VPRPGVPSELVGGRVELPTGVSASPWNDSNGVWMSRRRSEARPAAGVGTSHHTTWKDGSRYRDPSSTNGLPHPEALDEEVATVWRSSGGARGRQRNGRTRSGPPVSSGIWPLARPSVCLAANAPALQLGRGQTDPAEDQADQESEERGRVSARGVARGADRRGRLARGRRLALEGLELGLCRDRRGRRGLGRERRSQARCRVTLYRYLLLGSRSRRRPPARSSGVAAAGAPAARMRRQGGTPDQSSGLPSSSWELARSMRR